MKLYKIGFSGMFLGGSAIVKAASEDEAKQLVLARATEALPHITNTLDNLIAIQLKGTGILDFDNGDY